MIDNSDLNDLLKKAIISCENNPVLNFEVERNNFEKSWVAMGGSMKYFSFVDKTNSYIILDETAHKYKLSLIQSEQLLKMIGISWAFWLSRAEKAIQQEADLLSGLSKNTLVPNENITYLFQDNDEPENAVESKDELISQDNKNILGENYEFKDIFLIDKIKHAFISKQKIYATWDSPQKENIFFGSYQECLKIVGRK